jgi:hypothetical protein
VDGTDATVLLLEGVDDFMQADALIRQRGA